MKIRHMIIAMVTLGLIAALAGSSWAEVKVKGDKLKFALPNLEGKVISSDDEQFKGKVLLVDVWGSWCPPCRNELPVLKELQSKYKDEGFEVVGISFEHGQSDKERLATLKKFSKENELNYTVLFGGDTSLVEEKLPGLEGFTGFPTNFFIGRDGKVHDVKVGFSPGQAKELEAKVQKLLEEKAE
jgi:thiol-disulfide isomerase/thioredoxin